MTKLETEDVISQPKPRLLAASDWADYELLDSGNGLKLERFGRYSFAVPNRRPCGHLDLARTHGTPTAGSSRHRVAPRMTRKVAAGTLSPDLPEAWQVGYDGLRFLARPTSFRHLGFFPEQAPHWRWCAARIAGFAARHGRRPRVLNLFAYSGIASLHAAQAGAEVTHVDASKKAIAQAFENRDTAGMQDAPIRFITEDATRFVEREIRRGRIYDGIILDPPKYGRGPKSERWRIESDLVPLLQGCRQILSDTPRFLLLTIYAIRASSQAAHYALSDVMAGAGGTMSSGELVSVESQPEPRVIAQANYARWAPEDQEPANG